MEYFTLSSTVITDKSLLDPNLCYDIGTISPDIQEIFSSDSLYGNSPTVPNFPTTIYKLHTPNANDDAICSSDPLNYFILPDNCTYDSQKYYKQGKLKDASVIDSIESGATLTQPNCGGKKCSLKTFPTNIFTVESNTCSNLNAKCSSNIIDFYNDPGISPQTCSTIDISSITSIKDPKLWTPDLRNKILSFMKKLFPYTDFNSLSNSDLHSKYLNNNFFRPLYAKTPSDIDSSKATTIPALSPLGTKCSDTVLQPTIYDYTSSYCKPISATCIDTTLTNSDKYYTVISPPINSSYLPNAFYTSNAPYIKKTDKFITILSNTDNQLLFDFNYGNLLLLYKNIITWSNNTSLIRTLFSNYTPTLPTSAGPPFTSNLINNNLVINDSAGTLLWTSNSSPSSKGPFIMELNTDSSLQIVDFNNNIVWNTFGINLIKNTQGQCLDSNGWNSICDPLNNNQLFQYTTNNIINPYSGLCLDNTLKTSKCDINQQFTLKPDGHLLYNDLCLSSSGPTPFVKCSLSDQYQQISFISPNFSKYSCSSLNKYCENTLFSTDNISRLDFDHTNGSIIISKSSSFLWSNNPTLSQSIKTAPLPTISLVTNKYQLFIPPFDLILGNNGILYSSDVNGNIYWQSLPTPPKGIAPFTLLITNAGSLNISDAINKVVWITTGVPTVPPTSTQEQFEFRKKNWLLILLLLLFLLLLYLYRTRIKKVFYHIFKKYQK
jgi:hypothetical protein